MMSDKSFYAVHYLDEDGGLEDADLIEAADYWEACQIAFEAGAVEFQVFEGSREEVEELALACIRPVFRGGRTAQELIHGGKDHAALQAS